MPCSKLKVGLIAMHFAARDAVQCPAGYGRGAICRLSGRYYRVLYFIKGKSCWEFQAESIEVDGSSAQIGRKIW